MFVVGMEFRVDIVRRKLKSSIAVSVAGILTPLRSARRWPGFSFTTRICFQGKTSLLDAMLFLGASMCITALPVLARIIHFKKLSGTTIGTVALGAGAINDAAAWCLLAVVLASLDHNWSHALVNISGGLAYVAFTLLIVRPLLARAKTWLVKDGTLTEAGLVVALALMALGRVVHRSDRIARGLRRVCHGRRHAARRRGARSDRRAFNRSRWPCCFRSSSPTRG